MKKTFPIIIILITLSLLGLIRLQASWLLNLLELKESQLSAKVNEAATNVAEELGRVVYNGPVLRVPRRNSLRLNSDFPLNLMKPTSVEEKFSAQDVQAKLRRAFDSEELKKIKFEFAILNPSDELEFGSANFDKEFYDTVNNKRVFIPIMPPDRSNREWFSTFEHLVLLVPDFKMQLWNSLRWVIIGAALFMLVFIAAFYVTIKTLLNQKKVSEIKSDFINNMTHEFKTPLATISLAVDALRNDKVQANPEKMSYFTGIIKEENIRMNKHVETILQAALTERQELSLQRTELHAHDIIGHILDNYQLQLKEKNGTAELLLNAKNDSIFADEVHFTNLVSNLIDNAIKYSNDHLRIKISTHCTAQYFIMRVEDNGIGMSKETLKRIFEKFYRAHTGNLHNVKGFGLGMSYVKTVVDAHKGKIKVDSTLGKGSVFTIELPVNRT
ncbi:sensor histidine kinase [Sediminibacterium ginsengisoli]|uniref:histidine kinase n=1 Tax=Sediminibacterium ginsengisoli TaxID=413434 RepID=A0A1T4N3B5_9BACT|nr:HAMP domain-containing sensor histidine kinase [Sediminibacterium ginsengisoli]SJZ73348.1 two-component system, OmpR family, phosphate regulon sensor histidine kinase PhoR [Sediminibacterium ginsengisoli]